LPARRRRREYAPLFSRIEKDFGVERSDMLGVWGVESAFGDPVGQQHHMRPVIPSLATLAWAEPRRRDYWEMELINALTIIQRGWSTPEEMVGSWAGAMGHTQGMPEVWLHLGVDYDHDGKISPFGAPDDALASTALFRRARQVPAGRAAEPKWHSLPLNIRRHQPPHQQPQQWPVRPKEATGTAKLVNLPAHQPCQRPQYQILSARER
jgi:membrane-bound lytic murein transglycosylase B